MVLGALPDQESKYKLQSEIKQFEQSSDVDKKSNFNTTKTDMNEEEKTPFLKSVQRDLCSIEDLAKTIDLKSAQKFVDVVDRCTGNILVTGIGKVFKLWLTDINRDFEQSLVFVFNHTYSIKFFLKNSLKNFSGKSGVIGDRFAASLSSIGIASHYVHATEWAHGDLGKIFLRKIFPTELESFEL